MDNNYLMHHGVKGQQWGVRRYQNEDGSYKTGAKGRHDNDSSDKNTSVKQKGPSVGKAVAKGILKGVGIAAVGGVASSVAYKTGHRYVGTALATGTGALFLRNVVYTSVAATAADAANRRKRNV